MPWLIGGLVYAALITVKHLRKLKAQADADKAREAERD